jgi:hypothetical protein
LVSFFRRRQKQEKENSMSNNKKEQPNASAPQETENVESSIDLTGSCKCGAIEFRANGPILFNMLCHCRNCCRAVGISPIHICGMAEDNVVITKGEDLLTRIAGDQFEHGDNPWGDLDQYFCSTCGCLVYQCPSLVPVRSVMPINFHLQGDDGVTCLLPDKLKPKLHMNYENRMFDWGDDLPKYLNIPEASPLVNNDGSVIDEKQK